MPLWFCGALFIYNADRLRRDPADALNVPRRESAAQRLRPLSAAMAALSAAILVVLPAARRDWITLALVVSGAFVCLNYVVPMFGFRLKNVPVLKTCVPPTVVAAAIFVLPWLHGTPAIAPTHLAAAAAQAWGLLLFNMILCDLRDVEGDRRTGVLSLPGALGFVGTRRLLLLLLLAVETLTVLLAARSPAAQAQAWQLLCLLIPLYLGALLAAVRVKRSERFYEWWVEGMFALPALAVLGQSALFY